MKPLSNEQKEEIKQLVMPLVDDLHRVALSFCHNREVAEELVAETIARACQSYGRLRDKTKVRSWLMRILSNTFISHYRSMTRHPSIPYKEELSDDEEEQFSLFEKVSQPFMLWWGNPERELITKLMDEDIQKAIESLPLEFRLAVVLCDVEGYSYDEIAAVLTIPIGTVRSRIARGRSLLQKKLWHHASDIGLINVRKHNERSPSTVAVNKEHGKSDYENDKKIHQEH